MVLTSPLTSQILGVIKHVPRSAIGFAVSITWPEIASYRYSR